MLLKFGINFNYEIHPCISLFTDQICIYHFIIYSTNYEIYSVLIWFQI